MLVAVAGSSVNAAFLYIIIASKILYCEWWMKYLWMISMDFIVVAVVVSQITVLFVV